MISRQCVVSALLVVVAAVPILCADDQDQTPQKASTADASAVEKKDVAAERIVIDPQQDPGGVTQILRRPVQSMWPAGKVIYEQSRTERKIREALLQPADFDFTDTRLGDVLREIRQKYGIPIELDPESLAADSKGEETPVTKRLVETTLGNALHLILESLGLTYLIKNDTLLITTKTAASAPENLTVRIYQVHDLAVFPRGDLGAHPDIDSLIELIDALVGPANWDCNGSCPFIYKVIAPGVIALAVVHNEQGHVRVERFLNSIRSARVQEVFEARESEPSRSKPSSTDGRHD